MKCESKEKKGRDRMKVFNSWKPEEPEPGIKVHIDVLDSPEYAKVRKKGE